jgi:hypothetical protein
MVSSPTCTRLSVWSLEKAAFEALEGSPLGDSEEAVSPHCSSHRLQDDILLRSIPRGGETAPVLAVAEELQNWFAAGLNDRGSPLNMAPSSPPPHALAQILPQSLPSHSLSSQCSKPMSPIISPREQGALEEVSDAECWMRLDEQLHSLEHYLEEFRSRHSDHQGNRLPSEHGSMADAALCGGATPSRPQRQSLCCWSEWHKTPPMRHVVTGGVQVDQKADEVIRITATASSLRPAVTAYPRHALSASLPAYEVAVSQRTCSDELLRSWRVVPLPEARSCSQTGQNQLLEMTVEKVASPPRMSRCLGEDAHAIEAMRKSPARAQGATPSTAVPGDSQHFDYPLSVSPAPGDGRKFMNPFFHPTPVSEMPVFMASKCAGYDQQVTPPIPVPSWAAARTGQPQPHW